MNFFKNALKMSLGAAACCLIFPHYVYSYIDPGTGSYVFQIIVAAFVADGNDRLMAKTPASEWLASTTHSLALCAGIPAV